MFMRLICVGTVLPSSSPAISGRVPKEIPMTGFTKYLAAAAAVGGLSAPLAAQTSSGYQQPYPQSYPQQAYPGYPGQGYGYGQQGYAQNPVGQVIDQLLGNRYNVTDRQAIRQCATAAMQQAAARYGSGYGAQAQRYGQQYGQGYNRHAAMRVTAITDVQRRPNSLRVSGLLNSGGAYGGQYGNQANQNRDYAHGDLSFRCNVDYRGQVTNVRVNGNTAYRG